MTLLSIANVSMSVGQRVLLDEVNLSLNAGEHVALVGRNGCGKSSLLQAIGGAGTLPITGGQIQIQRNCTVGLLTQDPHLDPKRTLRDEVATAFEKLSGLHVQLEAVVRDMEHAAGNQLDRLMKRYERIEHEIHAAGGYEVEHQIDSTLHGLGLTDDLFNVKVGDLSGGQKRRLAMAKTLLARPDLLLLDEATNHLDLDGRRWLESFLGDYRGAVIIVSHDRWLLDRVASKIYELEEGKIFEYPGSYRQFRVLRAERCLAQGRLYEKQQQQIKVERGFIERYRAGQRARQARGREKRLDRFIRDNTVDAPVELDEVSIRMAPAVRSGDIVLKIEQVSKRYADRVLFEKFSLTIKRGDRIGIIGSNGTGKTTLASCLLGRQAPDSGSIRLGTQVDAGFYRQSQDHLETGQSVVQFLQQHVPGGTEQEARDLAGAFLFSGLDQEKRLGDLSGGERSRAALAALIAHGHNLLVLDEPTNHLDLSSVERLEEALKNFTRGGRGKGKGHPGTLILITHDRMLLNELVDQLLVVDGEGQVSHFLGTYRDFERSRQEESEPDAEAAKSPRPERRSAAKPREEPGGKRKSRENLERLSQEELEARIEQLEAQLAESDARLTDPQVYADEQAIKTLLVARDRQSAALAPLEAEWTRRAESEREAE